MGRQMFHGEGFDQFILKLQPCRKWHVELNWLIKYKIKPKILTRWESFRSKLGYSFFLQHSASFFSSFFFALNLRLFRFDFGKAWMIDAAIVWFGSWIARCCYVGGLVRMPLQITVCIWEGWWRLFTDGMWWGYGDDVVCVQLAERRTVRMVVHCLELAKTSQIRVE